MTVRAAAEGERCKVCREPLPAGVLCNELWWFLGGERARFPSCLGHPVQPLFATEVEHGP